MADRSGGAGSVDDSGAALEELDELLQDIAFEAANRLDWVMIVRQGFPALSEEQEQTLKDMGEAFAADQIVQREWDGPAPSDQDRRGVAETTERLAPRYELDVSGDVSQLLSSWGRSAGAGTSGSRPARRRRM